MPQKQESTKTPRQINQVDCVSPANGSSIVRNLMMSVDLVFGGWHRNLSRPFTLSGWTHEVCLNCGRQFPYDRVEIADRVPQQKDSRSPRGTAAPKPARSSVAVQLAEYGGV